MSSNVNKQGQLHGILVEPFITLADGSKWQLLLYHYVNNGDNLFTSTNATYCNEHGLFSRLAWINNFTYDSKYEFYVIQDGVEHRWTQTSVPTATSPAGLTVITGNPVQGIAKANQNNTYLGYNSWWGALGCWTKYSTGGKTGIPGFGPHNANGMCIDYIALYARIDTPKAFIEDGVESGVNIYEY